MSRLKMHAKRELSYDPQTTGVAWTLCQAHVEQDQIAAFVPEGVTCKKCLASIAWSEEAERQTAEMRKQREAAQ
jgi:hypothetical protein